jgi:acyl dehydratase
MKIFETLQSVPQFVGQGEVASEWITVTQVHVNQFADATGDHQWIHVDPERAKAGPFGATIAHGFLTLSLMPQFFDKAFKVQDQKMGINYGVNKVRFTAPVLVGSRLRAKMSLKSCDPIDNNGMQLVWSVTVEREGSDKPVCVAETVTRLYA